MGLKIERLAILSDNWCSAGASSLCPLNLPALGSSYISCMGNISNICGQAGELDCASEFMSVVAECGVLFHPVALTENEPTADYLVFLLSPSGEQSGPFFFVQVKTTSKGARPDGSYAYSFSLKDVQRAQAMKVPFFVCIVDRSTPSERRIFIKGVDSHRRKGIYRIPPTHDLTTDAVKTALHAEVTRAWATQKLLCLREFL